MEMNKDDVANRNNNKQNNNNKSSAERWQVSEGSRGREETGEVESSRERERERERGGGGLGVEVATGRKGGGVWEKLLPREKKRRRARRVPRGPHLGTKNKKKTTLPQTICATPHPHPPQSVFYFFIFSML